MIFKLLVFKVDLGFLNCNETALLFGRKRQAAQRVLTPKDCRRFRGHRLDETSLDLRFSPADTAAP